MKKITLLFTIIFASALNGMEPERPTKSEHPYDLLPQEVKKQIIIMALQSSKTVDTTIETMRRISALQGISFDKLFANFDEFTKIIHLLSKKFNEPAALVAVKLNTPATKEYIHLGNSLLNAIKDNNMPAIMQLLSLNADVNYIEYKKQNGHYIQGNTPLNYAIMYGNIDIVQLLLNSGAHPQYKNKPLKIDYDIEIMLAEIPMSEQLSNSESYNKLFKLLENAIKEQYNEGAD